MIFYLDGNDWEADYFISNSDYWAWQNNCCRLQNMYLDSAVIAGFTSEDKPSAAAYSATVPGCDRSVLLENGVIDDPYFGRNLDHSRWSENMSWAFRKRFSLPEELKNKQRFQLHFCGIDYRAALFFNGVYICDHEGMFIPLEVDVTDLIRKDGENTVALIFEPVPKALPDHQAEEAKRPAAFADYHRSQMSYGWDWMRGMVAAGIWDHVYIKGTDKARITDCFFRAQSSGKVELTVDSISQKKERFALEIDIKPLNFSGQSYHFVREMDLRHGENAHKFEFECPDPELWYPRNYGKQNLYKLTLELDGEITEKTVAFRTLEMHRNPGSPDRAYDQTFTFNGKEIFARGVNWVPHDLMLGNCTFDSYERQVRLAAEAGINLFRVWGGGIVEKEEFYDACDRYGIIVWQEFMHCCSCYRHDAEFVAFKAREADAVLRKIRNHVSVAMLCGGNEILYYGEFPDNPLYVQYREIAKVMAPDLPFHVSSPDRSRPGERDHGPWCFLPHKVLNKHDRLVASEVGCNGFPEYESVVKFIPDKEMETPDSQSWKYHFAIPCRAQDWHVQMPYFEVKNTFERCQATMFVQSDMLAYWMNHCRRKFPHTTGCFYWQYNEPWPTFFLSIIDYYTLPKMAYYHLMRVQKNTVLSLQEDSWCCTDGKFEADLFVTSDFETHDLECSFRLLSADGREILKQISCESVQIGSRKLADLETDLPDVLPADVVIAELSIRKNGMEIFHDDLIYGVPDYKKLFAAPAPEITATAVCRQNNDGENVVIVTIENTGFTAFNLRLDLCNFDHKKVYWRNNYLTVVSGKVQQVEAVICGEVMPDSVALCGWNMQKTVIPVTD